MCLLHEHRLQFKSGTPHKRVFLIVIVKGMYRIRRIISPWYIISPPLFSLNSTLIDVYRLQCIISPPPVQSWCMGIAHGLIKRSIQYVQEGPFIIQHRSVHNIALKLQCMYIIIVPMFTSYIRSVQHKYPQCPKYTVHNNYVPMLHHKPIPSFRAALELICIITTTSLETHTFSKQVATSQVVRCPPTFSGKLKSFAILLSFLLRFNISERFATELYRIEHEYFQKQSFHLETTCK